LAGDRPAFLIKKAARAGVLDDPKARSLDPSWRIRLRHALRSIAAENELYCLELLHREALAILALVGSDRLKSQLELVFTISEAIQDLCQPWRKDQKADKQNTDKLIDTWIDTWGDPNDPEVQKRIDATVKALEARTYGS